MSDTSPRLNFIEKGLIWLSTADSEILREHCPKWERLKYAAFGASLLVPFLFGMIAASYAVSTLTENVFIISGFAVVWGFIIITIDRVLLATYRAFIPFSRKMMQFFLRITVAILMGLTVSHPLTLMLFKDTINSEIEKARMEEMATAGGETEARREALNAQISEKTEALAELNKQYQEAMSGGFLSGDSRTPEPQVSEDTAIRYSPASNPQFADMDAQISSLKDQRDQIQIDLNRFQKDYDDEISGVRTGKKGIGPVARAIERDEIVWRRDEIKGFNKRINELSTRRNELSMKLTEENARQNAIREKSLREVEEQNFEMFKSRQGDMLAVIKSNIDAVSAELSGLTSQSTQIAMNTKDRVDSLKEEKRADLMVQTIVLHHLFEKEGGGFALAVYVVVACLFTLIDTIPLVVKFFAVPGIYDQIQEGSEKQDRKPRHVDTHDPRELKEKTAKTIDDVKERLLASLKDEATTKESIFEQLDLIYEIENYQPKSRGASEVGSTGEMASEPERSPDEKIVGNDNADVSNVINAKDQFQVLTSEAKTRPEDDFPAPRTQSPNGNHKDGEVAAPTPKIEINKRENGFSIKGSSPIKKKNGTPKPQPNGSHRVPVDPEIVRQKRRPKVTSAPATVEVEKEEVVSAVKEEPAKELVSANLNQPPVEREGPAQIPTPRAGAQQGAVEMPKTEPAVIAEVNPNKAQQVEISDKVDLQEQFSALLPSVAPNNDIIENPGEFGLGAMIKQEGNSSVSTPHVPGPAANPGSPVNRRKSDRLSLDPV